MNQATRFLMIILSSVIIFVVVVSSIFLVQQSPEAVQSATVVLEEKGFEPREITIKKGTTVTFTTSRNKPFWPASNLHPSHTIYPEFDPMHPLQPSETWEFTFDRPGDWAYHDHLRSYYVGTVHVIE